MTPRWNAAYSLVTFVGAGVATYGTLALTAEARWGWAAFCAVETLVSALLSLVFGMRAAGVNR